MQKIKQKTPKKARLIALVIVLPMIASLVGCGAKATENTAVRGTTGQDPAAAAHAAAARAQSQEAAAKAAAGGHPVTAP